LGSKKWWHIGNHDGTLLKRGKAWEHDGKAIEFLEVGVFFITMKLVLSIKHEKMVDVKE